MSIACTVRLRPREINLEIWERWYLSVVVLRTYIQFIEGVHWEKQKKPVVTPVVTEKKHDMVLWLVLD